MKDALRSQRAKLEREGATHFQVVHFSIQDDHLHLIVEAPDKRGIWRGVVGLEARITLRINKVLGRKGRLWGDRYHRHDLGSPTEVRNAIRYVLLNFQKHNRIIGDRNFADWASSAPTFDGFARPTWVFYDAAPRWESVVPRTWLLGVGWRQHGLIDPADTPSSSLFKHTHRM